MTGAKKPFLFLYAFVPILLFVQSRSILMMMTSVSRLTAIPANEREPRLSSESDIDTILLFSNYPIVTNLQHSKINPTCSALH